MPCGGRVSLIRMLSPCLSPQELERLALELREATQRVEREQQQAAGAAEELLTLTERLGEAERQLHRTRYPGSRPAPPDPFPPPPGPPFPAPRWLPPASRQLLECVSGREAKHADM